jgi:hypothetical protein
MKAPKYLLFLLVLAACERASDQDISPGNDDLIVVCGGITDEAKSHIVTLSYPATALNGSSAPVTGATVSITDGTTTWPLTEDDSIKGTYYTAAGVKGVAGNYYTLAFTTKTGSYAATDYLPSNSWFAPLKYTESSNGLYQITWVASMYNPSTPAMYEIFIDWSAVDGYQDSAAEDCRAHLYYYTLTSIDVSELFRPEIEKVYFPAGSVITEKRYSLSTAHEAFLRGLLIETAWRGGLYDATAANLPTNLSTGAIGFFSASSVYTLTIDVVP